MNGRKVHFNHSIVSKKETIILYKSEKYYNDYTLKNTSHIFRKVETFRETIILPRFPLFQGIPLKFQ